MKRRIHWPCALIVILVLITAGTPRPVRADGGVFPPSTPSHLGRDIAMPAQKAIQFYSTRNMGKDAFTTTLWDTISARWVIPVFRSW